MPTIRQTVRRFIPYSVRELVWVHVRSRLHLLRNLTYEFRRYSRWNLRGHRRSATSREADLILLTHMLQKGFTHADVRPFFGLDVIRRLLHILEVLQAGNQDSFFKAEALDTLRHYWSHHLALDIPEKAKPLVRNLESFLQRFPADVDHEPPRSTHRMTLQSLQIDLQHDALALIRQRHSVRAFAEAPVESARVEAAVRMAQCAPSACNLQPVRVHAVTERAMVERVAAVHLGSQSFARNTQLFLVITAELGLASGPRSLHQGYVDGGIFASTLMLTLLHEGIGSCPLHWSMMPSVDRQLRMLLSIPASENIVMLIAAGPLPSTWDVARSGRRPLEQVLRWHGRDRTPQ